MQRRRTSSAVIAIGMLLGPANGLGTAHATNTTTPERWPATDRPSVTVSDNPGGNTPGWYGRHRLHWQDNTTNEPDNTGRNDIEQADKTAHLTAEHTTAEWQQSLAPTTTTPQPDTQQQHTTQPDTLQTQAEHAQNVLRAQLYTTAEHISTTTDIPIDPQLLAAVWEQTTPQRRTAVLAAVGELGDPYIRWAAGPDGFDCSGLTMHAWQQANITLPHHAASQSRVAHKIGWTELEPGDLIFNRTYGQVGHVKMYIGAGLAIHASGYQGDGVVITTLNTHDRQERYGHIRTP